MASKEKKSVYIESTIPSYATARPSSNILNTIRKAQTETFWQIRDRFKFWISQDVIDEISQGDEDAARRRLNFIKSIELFKLELYPFRASRAGQGAFIQR